MSLTIEIDMPADLKRFRLPKAVDRRWQDLLDKQSREGKLSRAERQEAEGLAHTSKPLAKQHAPSHFRVANGTMRRVADFIP
jgi:hypothetical protein